ncbi:MAG: plastocyanin/azurin family copper-binding protein [Halapricum sp.]
MHRRDVLRGIGTTGALLVMGCVGQSETETGGGTTSTESKPTPEVNVPTEAGTGFTMGEAQQPTPSPRSGTVTVDVGPGTFYRPASLRVLSGTTVRWVWRSDNHNIAVKEQPDGADWEGHTPIEDTGYKIEFAFTVSGTYEYFCEPHIRQGMIGSVTVI